MGSDRLLQCLFFLGAATVSILWYRSWRRGKEKEYNSKKLMGSDWGLNIRLIGFIIMCIVLAIIAFLLAIINE